MNRFFWSAFCQQERIPAISEIEKIISRHGFLIDFKRFSDVSITMVVEMEEPKVDLLYSELKTYLILDELSFLNPMLNKECTVFINITFTKATGDLRIEVPSVPG